MDSMLAERNGSKSESGGFALTGCRTESSAELERDGQFPAPADGDRESPLIGAFF